MILITTIITRSPGSKMSQVQQSSKFFYTIFIVTRKVPYAPVFAELSPLVFILVTVKMGQLTFCVCWPLTAHSKNEPNTTFLIASIVRAL